MASEKDAAAMREQISNLTQRENVYEDWNKQLHEVCRKEGVRRQTAEADVERLAAALKAAAQEAMERQPGVGGGGTGAGDSAELEERCQGLQLELSREQDARRRAETDARRNAEQNQQLREKLQVLADAVSELELESTELKRTATALARASQ